MTTPLRAMGGSPREADLVQQKPFQGPARKGHVLPSWGQQAGAGLSGRPQVRRGLMPWKGGSVAQRGSHPCSPAVQPWASCFTSPNQSSICVLKTKNSTKSCVTRLLRGFRQERQQSPEQCRAESALTELASCSYSQRCFFSRWWANLFPKLTNGLSLLCDSKTQCLHLPFPVAPTVRPLRRALAAWIIWPWTSSRAPQAPTARCLGWVGGCQSGLWRPWGRGPGGQLPSAQPAALCFCDWSVL